MTLAEEVSRMIAEDEWKTHGLQDVKQGVTREGLAAVKLRLAERIVEHVRQAPKRRKAALTPEQRTAYQREYKRKRRQDPAFVAKESEASSKRWHEDAEYRARHRARKRALYARKHANANGEPL